MPSMTLPADQPAADKQAPKLSFGAMFRGADGRSLLFTFVLVSTLFALWGFCNGQLDVLNKHFQESLHLNRFQSGWVQFANFMGYFVMAIPAGLLAERFGYKGSIIIGLGLIAAGAFWFIPATRIGTYGAFLTGLFVLASGLAILETVANPYATVLGPPQAAATRINLAQTCNGVGVMLGPIVGGKLLGLSATEISNKSNDRLYLPYLVIGIVVTVLAVLFAVSKVPDIQPPSDTRAAAKGGATGPSLWSRPHFVWAVVAQFLYVGAQVAIWAFFINFVKDTFPRLGVKISDLGAASLFSLGGFGLFVLGRATGSMILRVSSPQRVLALYGLLNVIMMALVVAPLGWISVAGLFLSFFFMSIMFPTIFSLGIHGLGESTKRASSFIVMAIVGGALLPLATGFLADKFSMGVGFVVPLLCFLGVMLYGLRWERLHAASQ